MRLRLRYTKLGKVRWTSHRDVARMWERALRRAEVPVAYSEGFAPRPRLSFGLALPTGAESLGEYVDADVDADLEAAALPAVAARLGAALPAGMDVSGAVVIGRSEPSLQSDVVACSWEAELDAAAGLAAAVEAVLGAERVMVSRRRKGQEATDDIRPAILALDAVPTTAGARLVCELATQPRGLRPAELLGSLGVAVEDARVRRTHQWIERDGARREPLPPGATDAPHAVGRAS